MVVTNRRYQSLSMPQSILQVGLDVGIQLEKERKSSQSGNITSIVSTYSAFLIGQSPSVIAKSGLARSLHLYLIAHNP